MITAINYGENAIKFDIKEFIEELKSYEIWINSK